MSERLRAIGPDPREVTTSDPLVSQVRGLLARDDVNRLLGHSAGAELLVALGDDDLSVSKQRRHQIDNQPATFVKLSASAWGISRSSARQLGRSSAFGSPTGVRCG